MDLIIFSPTGTTRAVVEAVGHGMGAPSHRIVDLTVPRIAPFAPASGPAIIGMPVYAGRIPTLAAERLRQHIRGDGRPVVLIVVYGNRAYEDALLELRDLAVELHFMPVAAASFIGEHSFSTQQFPVAAGRPDTEDIRTALDFGQRIRDKLRHADAAPPLPQLQVPGNFPYREGMQSADIAPETMAENCVQCGECARSCPTAAITVTASGVNTHKALCLRCCACVRACHFAGRVMLHPRIQEFGRMLHEKYSRRAEPEIFL